jgi:hypothetical protein
MENRNWKETPLLDSLSEPAWNAFLVKFRAYKQGGGVNTLIQCIDVDVLGIIIEKLLFEEAEVAEEENYVIPDEVDVAVWPNQMDEAHALTRIALWFAPLDYEEAVAKLEAVKMDYPRAGVRLVDAFQTYQVQFRRVWNQVRLLPYCPPAKQLKRICLAGLKPPELADAVRFTDAVDFKTVLITAEREARRLQVKLPVPALVTPVAVPSVKVTDVVRSFAGPVGEGKKFSTPSPTGPLIRSTPASSSASGPQTSLNSVICWQCGQKGHLSTACPARKQAAAA